MASGSLQYLSVSAATEQSCAYSPAHAKALRNIVDEYKDS